MKYLLSIMLILCFSKTVLAQQPLTKALAQQYFSAIEQVEKLQQQYPELGKQMDDFSFADKTKFLSSIQELSFYPQINAAIQATGLKDVEQLYDLSMRIVGGLMATQIEQMPSGQNIDAMLAMKEKAVEEMQKANMPQAMREQMLQTLKEQEENILNMVKLSKKVSPQDKKFVQENIDWIMDNMPQDQDDH